eukprot:scaffold1154_cov310-Pinguiococcus_pyrenoidosus.AAC.26
MEAGKGGKKRKVPGQDIVDRVVVGLLDERRLCRAGGGDCASRLAHVEEGHQAVVGSAHQSIRGLGVEAQAAEGRLRQQLRLRVVGVADVPDVGLHRHPRVVEPRILEVENAVGHRDLARALGIPVDAGGRALDVAGVAEHGQALRGGRLAGVVRDVPREVRLVDVNGVVLPHARADDRSQGLYGVLVLLVLLRLLAEAVGIALLGEVHVLRPAAFLMAHARAPGHQALRVGLVRRHHGRRIQLHNAAEDRCFSCSSDAGARRTVALPGIAHDVVVAELVRGLDALQQLGRLVTEAAVLAELRPRLRRDA